jgi:hypothetical protein
MTFNFRTWLVQSPCRTRSNTPSLFYPLVHRPILVAQWHRGADGKLECHWERLPD